MMNQTNLAYKWVESEETLMSEAANAAAISQLLQLKTRGKSPVAPARRPQMKRMVFRDNYSGDFKAFRVY